MLFIMYKEYGIQGRWSTALIGNMPPPLFKDFWFPISIFFLDGGIKKNIKDKTKSIREVLSSWWFLNSAA